jgi:predicted HTH domain antitoxin
MQLTIDIPAGVQESLEFEFGPDLSRAATEALAIAWYRAEKLSIGQVAELLGVSVYDAEGLMKRHQIAAPYSVEDFEQDRATLQRLLGS